MNSIHSAPTLFILVAASALVLQLFSPWWIVVAIGFAAGLLSRFSPWKTFLIVFSAIGLLWLAVTLYLTATNSAVLIPRMAALLELPASWMVFALTILIGALPASLAALGASWLRYTG